MSKFSKLQPIKMELTSTQKLLLSLILLIQSTVGMALSVTNIWTYSEKLLLVVGEDNAKFYLYFSVFGLFINIIMFVGSFISVTRMFTNSIVRRRSLSRRHGRGGVYGAFGYYSVV